MSIDVRLAPDRRDHREAARRRPRAPHRRHLHGPRRRPQAHDRGAGQGRAAALRHPRPGHLLRRPDAGPPGSRHRLRRADDVDAPEPLHAAPAGARPEGHHRQGRPRPHGAGGASRSTRRSTSWPSAAPAPCCRSASRAPRSSPTTTWARRRCDAWRSRTSRPSSSTTCTATTCWSRARPATSSRDRLGSYVPVEENAEGSNGGGS